jgi:hypothetical protein
VLEQFGDPLAILEVGLAPGHGFDVLGIDQDHLALPFEDVPHMGFQYTPVDSIATCVTC